MEHIALNDMAAVLAITRKETFRATAVEINMSTTGLKHSMPLTGGKPGYVRSTARPKPVPDRIRQD
jgi:hypothetical protein